jgi:hypothetical protein
MSTSIEKEDQYKLVIWPCHGRILKKTRWPSNGPNVIERTYEDLRVVDHDGKTIGHFVGVFFHELRTIYIDDESFLVEDHNE